MQLTNWLQVMQNKVNSSLAVKNSTRTTSIDEQTIFEVIDLRTLPLAARMAFAMRSTMRFITLCIHRAVTARTPRTFNLATKWRV